MADGVLFLGGKLGKASVTNHEKRIVAETALAFFLVADSSLAFTSDDNISAVGKMHADTADETGGALVVGNAVKSLEQLIVVRLVVSVLAGIACRIHARFTA